MEKEKCEKKRWGRRRKERKTEKAEKKDTKQIVPFLRSFGDEPVMVTVAFGEEKDAGR